MSTLTSAKTAGTVDVKRPSPESLEAAEATSHQYAHFLRRHGAVRAFRDGSSYRLHVFDSVSSLDIEERHVWKFGNDNGSPVYFLRSEQAEPRVVSFTDGEMDVHGSFDEWLDGAFERAFNSYSEEGWNELLNGAPSFSNEELQILEARRRFSIAIDGIEPDNRIRFRVHNGSERTLPWLTVSIRSDNLEGAVWLDVSNVLPGTTASITRSVYGTLTDPSKIEARLEEPMPDDRASFRELTHSLPTRKR